MAKLIYSVIASLDGYIEDRDGNFDWAAPDEEVHSFVNDQERNIGTYLLGRRMYETMMVWETDPNLAGDSPFMRDYAQIWQAADKIVYTRTLQAPYTRRTKIEPEFDPQVVKRLKDGANRDLGIGGANLAATAFAHGLIDEYHVVLAPAIVGGGKRALPDGVRLDLELLHERRFANGMVFLNYRVRL